MVVIGWVKLCVPVEAQVLLQDLLSQVRYL